jgi:hypothetical protein
MNIVSTAHVLPRTLSDINGLLSVVFIEPVMRLDKVKTMFRIHKRLVWAFLLWLKEHNVLYDMIEMDGDKKKKKGSRELLAHRAATTDGIMKIVSVVMVTTICLFSTSHPTFFPSVVHTAAQRIWEGRRKEGQYSTSHRGPIPVLIMKFWRGEHEIEDEIVFPGDYGRYCCTSALSDVSAHH